MAFFSSAVTVLQTLVIALAGFRAYFRIDPMCKQRTKVYANFIRSSQEFVLDYRTCFPLRHEN